MCVLISPGNTTFPAPWIARAFPSASPGQAPAPEIQLPKITIRRDAPKVGRNDLCPCGSGKKFKHCHGA